MLCAIDLMHSVSLQSSDFLDRGKELLRFLYDRAVERILGRQTYRKRERNKALVCWCLCACMYVRVPSIFRPYLASSSPPRDRGE